MEITTKPLLAAVQLIPPIPGHAAHTERTAVADHTTAAAKSASNQAPHKKEADLTQLRVGAKVTSHLQHTA